MAAPWRAAAAITLVIAFVHLSVLVPLAGAQDASEPSVVMGLQVSGSTATLSLDTVLEPVGAFEVELTGFPARDGECVFPDGIGACQETDGILRVVGLNPTGWPNPVVLAEIEFVESVSGDVGFVIDIVTDAIGESISSSTVLNGVPIDGSYRSGAPAGAAITGNSSPTESATNDVAATSSTASSSDGSGGSGLLIVAVAVIVALAGAAFVVMRRSAGSTDSLDDGAFDTADALGIRRNDAVTAPSAPVQDDVE